MSGRITTMSTTLVSSAPALISTNLDDTVPIIPTTSVHKQPEIEYQPNESQWKARAARRLAEDSTLPRTPLPEGFPTKLDSPLVWEGLDWKDPREWEYELSADHLKEIDDAVKHFNGLGKPFGFISAETFPLPTLGPVLRELSKDLHNGRGFFVLRTIPVEKYSREDNILLYAGISSHIGPRRGVQDATAPAGSPRAVLAHIKDLTETYPLKAIGSPAYTTEKQVFHTDKGDIISLYVLQTATEGGLSRISSSWRVYNELAKTRPDLIKTLSEPWDLDSFGGNPPYVTRPLLYWKDPHIIIQYARRLFTGYQGLPRSSNIPPITEAQAEALDTLHFLAEKYSLGLNFQKGDIQYINNLSIFHGRDGYVDTPEHKRHLLRLWLRDEELGWEIPAALEPTWKRLYYSTAPENERFPTDPGSSEYTSIGGAKYA